MATAFERLVTRLSTHFITSSSDEIDAGIDHALAELGVVSGVDRVYVFEFHEHSASNTHEWVAAGVSPQLEHFQAVPYEAFPWWTEQVRKRRLLHFESLADLPAEAEAERSILAEQEVKSVVAVPLSFGHRVFGFVGFDAVRTHKRWAVDEIALLQVVGEMLVNAIARREAELDRARLETELAEARRLEAIGRLAGGVAHDFNNMLTVVLNAGRMLKRAVQEPSHREYAEQIIASAERATDLTRQLLRIGRREVVEREVIDLRRTLGELLPLLDRVLREDLRLELDLADVGPVEVGRPQIEQVLVNLALNARDAMPAGGTLRIGLDEVVAAAGRREARLSVTDSGQGMTPEVRARIFEPFFTTKGEHGTGLGLATVYGIVRQAGGQVEVESSEGVGTRFTVRLPISSGPVTTRRVRSATPSVRGAGEPVLVVEDVPEVRGIVAKLLDHAGYRVTTAASPEEALDYFEGAEVVPRLVVSDVVMPGFSGVELAKRLAARHPDTRFVFMSGYDDALLASSGIEAPHLAKPFSEEELLAAVRRALA